MNGIHVLLPVNAACETTDKTRKETDRVASNTAIAVMTVIAATVQ